MHRSVLLYYLTSNTCHNCPRNRWINQSIYIICTSPYCFTTSHQIFVTAVLEIDESINQYAYYAQARTALLPLIKYLSVVTAVQEMDGSINHYTYYAQARTALLPLIKYLSLMS